jgi:hypothetical protein
MVWRIVLVRVTIYDLSFKTGENVPQVTRAVFYATSFLWYATRKLPHRWIPSYQAENWRKSSDNITFEWRTAFVLKDQRSRENFCGSIKQNENSKKFRTYVFLVLHCLLFKCEYPEELTAYGALQCLIWKSIVFYTEKANSNFEIQ